MSWRVIYITQSEKISLYLDSLQIQKGEDKYTIPLSDIGTIVLEDYKTLMTVKLMNKLIDYHILFVTCDDQYNPCGTFMPLNDHYRQCKTVQSQIIWDQELKDAFWEQLVRRKIDNQVFILKKLRKNKKVIENMERFSKEVVLGDTGNREGLAAKIYFRELFGKEFKRRGDSGIINSGLNYGYTILHSKINRVLASKGLLTYLGIHHKSEYNRFNLGSDLVEVYRPVVDYWVYTKLMEAEYFSRDHRIELVNLLNARIMTLGKRETVSKSMEKFVDILLNFFETGELNELKFPSLDILKLYEL